MTTPTQLSPLVTSPPAAKRRRVDPTTAAASAALTPVKTADRTMQALVACVRAYGTYEYAQISTWTLPQAILGYNHGWGMHALSLCSKELYAATPRRDRTREDGFLLTCQTRALKLYPETARLADIPTQLEPTIQDAGRLWIHLTEKLKQSLSSDHQMAAQLVGLGIGITERSRSRVDLSQIYFNELSRNEFF